MFVAPFGNPTLEFFNRIQSLFSKNQFEYIFERPLSTMSPKKLLCKASKSCATSKSIRLWYNDTLSQYAEHVGSRKKLFFQAELEKELLKTLKILSESAICLQSIAFKTNANDINFQRLNNFFKEKRQTKNFRRNKGYGYSSSSWNSEVTRKIIKSLLYFSRSKHKKEVEL